MDSVQSVYVYSVIKANSFKMPDSEKESEKCIFVSLDNTAGHWTLHGYGSNQLVFDEMLN